MLKFNLLLFLMMLLSLPVSMQAQELKAEVTLSTPKLQTTDPIVFKTLEQDLKEFLNQERWTDDEYRPYERIECNFQVNITGELGNNTYSADIAFKAIRPVYGSEYKTIIVNHVDRDVIFRYLEFQPMVNGSDFFKDNLSAVFSFYAHLIIGLDAESFAPDAGNDHFLVAQNILNQVPTAISDSDKGWGSTSKKTNRYWIIENLLSPRYSAYREAWYNFHRKSLDMLYLNPALALQTMVDALVQVEKTNASYPNSIGILMFLTAKRDEIVEIMVNGSKLQRSTTYDIMRKLDPSNNATYSALRN